MVAYRYHMVLFDIRNNLTNLNTDYCCEIATVNPASWYHHHRDNNSLEAISANLFPYPADIRSAECIGHTQDAP